MIGTEFKRFYKKSGRYYQERVWFDGKDWWFQERHRRIGNDVWKINERERMTIGRAYGWFGLNGVQRVA